MLKFYRSVLIKLKKNCDSRKMMEPWIEMFGPLIDNLQLEIDKKHLASEVHMLFKIRH